MKGFFKTGAGSRGFFFLVFLEGNRYLPAAISGVQFDDQQAPGFVVPFVGGPKAVSFAVGSVSKKPGG
ncbi:MAG TPA: hypothetical protein ENN41_10310 [Sediminispirochaeta sp.]|nr:hypothetical protein [Sediminispirochaeta sp.]